jgi:GNAT superfamily N-acetyltransferase
MEAMDGPINFGDRSDWWGVLVEGFTEPLYCNPYNRPYYRALFENYGFQNYFNQYTFYRDMTVGDLNPIAVEKAERLFRTAGYRFEYAHRKDLGSYAEDFHTIYNGAWAKFTGVKPIDAAHARALMDNMKPIVDRRLLIFAYYEDQPIGFFVMVPDLNRIVGRFNGKFGLWQKLRLLYLLKCKKSSDRIFAIIFGVLPEFQGKGVEGGLIRRFEIEVEKGDLPYKSLELAWVGDFNPVMVRFVESYVCAKKFKTHVTYRYLFDREKPFERAPRMGRSKPAAPAAAPASEAPLAVSAPD